MRYYLGIIIIAIFLSVLQSSFISVLSSPLNLVNLPLLLVTYLALKLKFRLSILIAIICGLTIDLLSPQFFGIYSISFLVAVVVAVVLLSSVLTHHTITATGGVSLAVFVAHHFTLLTLSSFYRFLSSGPFWHSATFIALENIIWATIIQIIIAVLIRTVVIRMRGLNKKAIIIS